MYVYVENGRGQGTVDTLPLPFLSNHHFWRLIKTPHLTLYLPRISPAPRPTTSHT